MELTLPYKAYTSSHRPLLLTYRADTLQYNIKFNSPATNIIIAIQWRRARIYVNFDYAYRKIGRLGSRAKLIIILINRLFILNILPTIAFNKYYITASTTFNNLTTSIWTDYYYIYYQRNCRSFPNPIVRCTTAILLTPSSVFESKRRSQQGLSGREQARSGWLSGWRRWRNFFDWTRAIYNIHILNSSASVVCSRAISDKFVTGRFQHKYSCALLVILRAWAN